MGILTHRLSFLFGARFLRWLLVSFGILVILAAFFLLIFVFHLAGRESSHGTSGLLLHPRIVQSPFTFRQGIGPEKFGETLNIPIFPSSVGLEYRDFTSTGTADRNPPRPTTMIEFVFSSKTTIGEVDLWYKSHLPAGFSRVEFEQLKSNTTDREWVQQLDRRIAGHAVLYEIHDSGNTRGLLIESEASDSVRIILFVHAESRG